MGTKVTLKYILGLNSWSNINRVQHGILQVITTPRIKLARISMTSGTYNPLTFGLISNHIITRP